MKNIEFYKKEMKEMFEKKNIRLCHYIKELDSFVTCQNCPLHKDYDCKYCDTGKSVDWLLEEHKEKNKLKQWEFDLIETNDKSRDNKFKDFKTYQYMLGKGHFKGIYDTFMTLQEILENYEIVPDDYGFGE